MGTTSSEFEDDEAKQLGDINIAVGAVSFCASTFIIACFLRFKPLRSFAFKLIVCVALSDWWNSVGNMMGDAGGRGADTDSHRPQCQFQAFLISYFELTSVLWSAAIAYTLHRAFLQEDANYAAGTIDERAKLYHGLIWGGALVLSLLPFTSDSYGDTGAWCWIRRDTTADVAWRYVQFYIPLWVCIVYCTYVYVRVVRKMRQLVALAVLHGHSASEKAHNIWAMKYYPLVMCVCFFWATANRLYQTFGGGLVLWLNGLHVFFAAAQGTGNFLVYVNTPQVQQQLRLFLYPYCSCITLKPEDSQAVPDEHAHGPGAASVALNDASAEAPPAAITVHTGAAAAAADAAAAVDVPAAASSSSGARAPPGSTRAAPRTPAAAASDDAGAFGFHSVDNAQDAAAAEHDAPLPEPVVPTGTAADASSVAPGDVVLDGMARPHAAEREDL